MSLWVRRRAGSAQVSLRGINDVDVPITVTADWQRYSYTAVANSTTGRVGVRLTANGDAVDIYGGQLELLPYMTSYIPTTSAAVSRAAEMASITGAAFSSWFNAGQGSFVVGLRWAYLQSTSVAAGISVSDGTVSNAHSLVRSGVGAVPQYSAAVAGVSQAAPYAGAVTAMVPFLCAFAYAANDFAIRTQGAGGSFAADSSGALPVVDRLNFGATDGSVARKHVTRLAYYPKRLLDAELATLSTQ
jgi:hypothetical protein